MWGYGGIPHPGFQGYPGQRAPAPMAMQQQQPMQHPGQQQHYQQNFVRLPSSGQHSIRPSTAPGAASTAAAARPTQSAPSTPQKAQPPAARPPAVPQQQQHQAQQQRAAQQQQPAARQFHPAAGATSHHQGHFAAGSDGVGAEQKAMAARPLNMQPTQPQYPAGAGSVQVPIGQARPSPAAYSSSLPSPGMHHMQGTAKTPPPQYFTVEGQPPSWPGGGGGISPPTESPQPGSRPLMASSQAPAGGSKPPMTPKAGSQAPSMPCMGSDLEGHVEVWIVRHGQTDENVSRTIAGHNNSGLTPLGKQQADLTAQRLKGMKFKSVYISDLVRTKQTADPIIRLLPKDTASYTDKRLREKGAGNYVGFKLGYSEHMAQCHGQHFRTFRPPGLGGESWDDVARRGKAWLKEVVERFCVAPEPKDPSQLAHSSNPPAVLSQMPSVAGSSSKGAHVPPAGGGGGVGGGGGQQGGVRVSGWNPAHPMSIEAQQRWNAEQRRAEGGSSSLGGAAGGASGSRDDEGGGVGSSSDSRGGGGPDQAQEPGPVSAAEGGGAGAGGGGEGAAAEAAGPSSPESAPEGGGVPHESSPSSGALSAQAASPAPSVPPEVEYETNRILVVTHGGFIGEMLMVAGCPAQKPSRNCSIHVMEVTKRRGGAIPEFRLLVEQEVAHLTPLEHGADIPPADKKLLNNVPTTESPHVPTKRIVAAQAARETAESAEKQRVIEYAELYM